MKLQKHLKVQSLISIPKLHETPKTAIIVPTQSVFVILRRVLQKHIANDDVRKKILLGDAVAYQQFGDLGVIGPALGAPAATLAGECVLSSGTRRLILFGTAGGLNSPERHLHIGDFLEPRGAISEEGTSILYGASKCEPSSTSTLQKCLNRSLSELIPQHFPQFPRPETHKGLIWSTDGPFRETREKVSYFSKHGALAVDMEYAALSQLTKIYQTDFACIFVLSDLLGESWDNGMSSRALKNSLKLAAEAILALK